MQWLQRITDWIRSGSSNALERKRSWITPNDVHKYLIIITYKPNIQVNRQTRR